MIIKLLECKTYRKYSNHAGIVIGWRKSLTPGHGVVRRGRAGRRWWRLREAEHLCSSESSHRGRGRLYGPESPAAQPPAAEDTWAPFILDSQITRLLYRLIVWHHATQHSPWRRGRHRNCRQNQSAAVQQTRHPDQRPAMITEILTRENVTKCERCCKWFEVYLLN